MQCTCISMCRFTVVSGGGSLASSDNIASHQSWPWVSWKVVSCWAICDWVGRGMSEYPSKALKTPLITGFYKPDMLLYLPLIKTHAGERTWLDFTSISFPHGSKLRRGRSLGQRCFTFVDELPLMSTAAGSGGYSVGQSYDKDHGMINLDVRTLTGEEFRLRVERSTLGSEVRKMVLDHLPAKSGAKLVLDHMRHQTSEQGGQETVRLKLHQTLQEQGLAEAETAILCCTYVPTQLQSAWRFLMGFETPEAELSLEGVTHLNLTTASHVGRFHLPKSLISLTFVDDFDQSLELLTIPTNLQNLTLGGRFNQSLERAKSLQSLTFADDFDQSLESVTLPNSLQKLTFGSDFNQSLERVTWPNSLQNLTFGREFNQSLEHVTLPNSLQKLTFGSNFNQSLEGVTLPHSLQDLTFERQAKGFTSSTCIRVE